MKSRVWVHVHSQRRAICVTFNLVRGHAHGAFLGLSVELISVKF